MADARSPISPRLQHLPFEGLAWEGFEAFCHDLISRTPEVGGCHHYGKQGDTQLGIDLFAERENGERWAFQNKRWKSFGPAEVGKAVSATTYEADRYFLLLSREATAGARAAIAEHANWDIWDVRDLSQKVRELPLETARRLLDQHFGSGVRRGFLGVSAVSTFLTSHQFFLGLEDAARLFHHSWSTVGRATWLRILDDFIQSPTKRVAVLTGRGGTGKSKLLFDLDRQEDGRSGYALRFVAEGLSVTAESFDDLPLSPCVVIVDDAHRRDDDLPALFALLRQRSLPLKLILAGRPRGMDGIDSHLSRAGIDDTEVERFGELGDLSREEIRQLALQALGSDYAEYADQLIAAAWDSPLVTVVGGKLLAERSVDPSLLATDVSFRSAVLSKFEDVVVGEAANRIEPAFCRELLSLLSAVVPVHPANEAFLRAAADFLKCEQSGVIAGLGALEEAGVLLRRGNSLRITPDVLADHLLRQACLTPQGRATGYAQRVFDRFLTICPTELLRNLAELDWRSQQANEAKVDVLAGIWEAIVTSFRDAPNSGRRRILETLEDVAYYQPRRMFELVRLAARQPATAEEPELVRQFASFDNQDVLDELPELLRRIAFSLEHLPACADLLWELGRNDRKATNNAPKHPLRVLSDLAAYEVGKPFAFNREMVCVVRQWMKEPSAFDHQHSPLDVLDRVFAKTGSNVFAEGHGLLFKTFLVSRSDTQEIRADALDIVRSCAKSDDLRVVLRAVSSLQDALRDPLSLHGIEISAEHRDQWLPEQLEIMDVLAELQEQTTPALVHLQICNAVEWHARYSAASELRKRGRQIVLRCPKRLDVRLARAIRIDHHFDDFSEFDESIEASVSSHQQRRDTFLRDVAQELWATLGPEQVLAALETMVKELAAQQWKANAGPILDAVLAVRPDQSEFFCESVLANPDSALTPNFALLLLLVRRQSAERAVIAVGRALDLERDDLSYVVANYYCWNVDWTSGSFVQDVAILARLLVHRDLDIRAAAVGALRGLGSVDFDRAISLARSLDFGGSDRVAENLFSIFDADMGISPASLSADDIDSLLAKLEEVRSIDYHAGEFLAFAARRLPQRVVDALLVRVEHEQRTADDRFEPLPHLGLKHALSGLVDASDYEHLLSKIRDRSLGASGVRSYWLPKLFEEVSLQFCEVGLQVLTEWIESGDGAKIAAAVHLLSEASSDFVFDRPEFVETALTKAQAAGDECLSQATWSLRRCASSGIRTKSGAGPFPRDVRLRDRATEASRLLRPGTPAFQFYESLRSEAEANIRETLARDEEVLD